MTRDETIGRVRTLALAESKVVLKFCNSLLTMELRVSRELREPSRNQALFTVAADRLREEPLAWDGLLMVLGTIPLRAGDRKRDDPSINNRSISPTICYLFSLSSTESWIYHD